MRQALLWCAILSVVISPLDGQQSTIPRLDGSKIGAAQIDQTMSRLMKSAQVVGAEIAVINQGKISYQKAYGFRDSEKKLPLTVDSIMSAASISKSAFAYLAMELVDDGALDLDQPVYQYLPKPLPEYPRYADLANDARYKKITARMLLSHTCGFPNWRALEDDRKLKIHFEPGSRYAYSGEGIDLLQLVVETISGRPLEESMRERVFQPLGMTRTSMLWQDRFESNFANAYDEYGRSLGPHRWTRADAAGSMQTTAGDIARLLLAVTEGKQLRPATREQILRPQIRIKSKHQFPSLNEEKTDQNGAIRLSYGLGWGLYWSPAGEAAFKEGHDDGWRNYAVAFDKQKSGIVILTNSSNGEGIFQPVLETVLKDTFTPIEWEGYTPYNKLPPRPALKSHKRVTVSPPVLDAYAGRYAVDANVVLTIRREDDHLSVQENEEPSQKLLPESQTDFFSTASDDSFTFEKDSAGRVTRLLLHVDGKDIPAKRIE